MVRLAKMVSVGKMAHRDPQVQKDRKGLKEKWDQLVLRAKMAMMVHKVALVKEVWMELR